MREELNMTRTHLFKRVVLFISKTIIWGEAYQCKIRSKGRFGWIIKYPITSALSEIVSLTPHRREFANSLIGDGAFTFYFMLYIFTPWSQLGISVPECSGFGCSSALRWNSLRYVQLLQTARNVRELKIWYTAFYTHNKHRVLGCRNVSGQGMWGWSHCPSEATLQQQRHKRWSQPGFLHCGNSRGAAIVQTLLKCILKYMSFQKRPRAFKKSHFSVETLTRARKCSLHTNFWKEILHLVVFICTESWKTGNVEKIKRELLGAKLKNVRVPVFTQVNPITYADKLQICWLFSVFTGNVGACQTPQIHKWPLEWAENYLYASLIISGMCEDLKRICTFPEGLLLQESRGGFGSFGNAKLWMHNPLFSWLYNLQSDFYLLPFPSRFED